MSTVFNDIQAALDTRLNSLGDGTPIAWPNVDYTPEAGTTFYRPNFIPGDTVQASLGANGKDYMVGIYQVDIVTPRGSGRSGKVDTIADHFSRGSVLSYNGSKLTVRSVSIGPAINDGAWLFTPVSISVQIYSEARP